MRDEVLLTAGEPAYVPVLDNDVDPDGEVLVVLGVSDLPEPSPITVTALRRSVLKIEAPFPRKLHHRKCAADDQPADGPATPEP